MHSTYWEDRIRGARTEKPLQDAEVREGTMMLHIQLAGKRPQSPLMKQDCQKTNDANATESFPKNEPAFSDIWFS